MAEVLTNLLPSQLADYLAPHGFTAGEARRIFAHRVHHMHDDFRVRDLAKHKQQKLESLLECPRLEVVDRSTSDADGFCKYLFKLHDGLMVEAVRIPIFDTKYTVCISSQAGCALKCAFCATGKMGWKRDLEPWEIVEQLLTVRREAKRPVRGIVFMGMGEPFLNYDAVIQSARIFSDPSGTAISGDAITISTAGIVPAIRRYTAEKHPYRLAISLTSAIKEKRKWLMPIEKKYGLDQLIPAIREHAEATRDRVTLEYVAIAGVNCAREDAEALARELDGIPIRLNLIEVNDASGEFQPPDDAEFRAFRDALQILKQPIVRRYSGGKDIRAACGMLAATSA